MCSWSFLLYHSTYHKVDGGYFINTLALSPLGFCYGLTLYSFIHIMESENRVGDVSILDYHHHISESYLLKG